MFNLTTRVQEMVHSVRPLRRIVLNCYDGVRQVESLVMGIVMILQIAQVQHNMILVLHSGMLARGI